MASTKSVRKCQNLFDGGYPRGVQLPGNLHRIAATTGNRCRIDGTYGVQRSQEQLRIGDRFFLPAQASMKIAGAGLEELFEALRATQCIGTFQ